MGMESKTKTEDSCLYVSMSEIKKAIIWAAEQIDFPVGAAKLIPVKFNGRFTRRMGDASFKYGIRLSKPLWPLASPEERKETVVHEFCHIVDMWYGRENGEYTTHHGPSWRKLMRKCGYEGSRCHQVPRGKLVRKNKGTKEYTCSCGVTHFLGKKRVLRHERGIRLGGPGFVCRKCKGNLKEKTIVGQ